MSLQNTICLLCVTSLFFLSALLQSQIMAGIQGKWYFSWLENADNCIQFNCSAKPYKTCYCYNKISLPELNHLKPEIVLSFMESTQSHECWMFSWMAGGQISCHSPSLCSALANIRNARNLLFYWIQRRHSSSRLWWFCPQLNSRLHVEFGKFFFAVPSSARFVSYKRGSLSSSKLETSVHCYCYVCFTFIYCFVYWNCKVLQLAQIKWEKLGKQHSMSELIWNKHCVQWSYYKMAKLKSAESP